MKEICGRRGANNGIRGLEGGLSGWWRGGQRWINWEGVVLLCLLNGDKMWNLVFNVSIKVRYVNIFRSF